MKYVLVIVIMFCAGSIGKIIEEKYNKKVKIYEILINFADFLLINIYNLSENILFIFEKYEENLNKETRKDFEKIIELIISNNLTQESIVKIKLFNEIKSYELLDIVNFFNSLGKNNLESQITLIDNYKHIFKLRYDESKINQTKKGNISFKMSICIGIMFSILIV